MAQLDKDLREIRQLTLQRPPGPPPRPGLTWDSQKRRWIKSPEVEPGAKTVHIEPDERFVPGGERKD